MPAVSSFDEPEVLLRPSELPPKEIQESRLRRLRHRGRRCWGGTAEPGPPSAPTPIPDTDPAVIPVAVACCLSSASASATSCAPLSLVLPACPFDPPAAPSSVPSCLTLASSGTAPVSSTTSNRPGVWRPSPKARATTSSWLWCVSGVYTSWCEGGGPIQVGVEGSLAAPLEAVCCPPASRDGRLDSALGGVR